ncbi:hypothetical protein M514_00592 [Trichuris suis]|uniref:Uncharacterized protein n=1 Tax=Trichuris suis TaxID=68888 RepID=A0A085MMC0_9BILA|nr:hypothetical protein M513_00592 [Trichuris suis]KFD61230.1 hypothetical protein M514_00592 [Trichuris suis]
MKVIRDQLIDLDQFPHTRCSKDNSVTVGWTMWAHDKEEDNLESSEKENRVMVISLIETGAGAYMGAISTTSRIVASMTGCGR